VSVGEGRGRGRGRPPCCPRDLAVRIILMRERGLSYTQICDVLNAEKVPTPMGGKRWLKSHVDRLLHTRYVRELYAELDGGIPRGAMVPGI
jgi:hypothetical protein